ncbi:hypothetical protein CVS40_11827 [Lucilia cuprina]|nr:hypothetical protein CVS40_11827 [Lucilia cuprina]
MDHEEAVIPLLIGRDLLGKFNIHLCHIERKYSIRELMKLNGNKNGLNKLVSSALMSFDILKSPREDDRGVPVIGDKHRILNLPFGKVDNFECGDIGYLDMDDIGAITLDKGQLGVMGKDFAGDLPEGGPYVIRECVGNDRYEVTDVENCQVTQMPYKGIVDSTRLRKWLEPTGDVDDYELDSEGNTDKYTDYEYLEDEDLDYKSDDE